MHKVCSNLTYDEPSKMALCMWQPAAAALPFVFKKEAEFPHLHQMCSHNAPGPHHVEQRSVLVPDDPQHGLAQTEEMESTASVQRRLGLSYTQKEENESD